MPVVLVVEDEWLLRLEIADMLRSAGWEVHEAGNGHDALESLVKDEDLGLLVTDIQLGDGPTGWDIAERGRALHGALPVIYTSGNPVDRARKVAGSLFFSKPIRLEDLAKACGDRSWAAATA